LLSKFQIFHEQSSLAVATIFFLRWRAKPPIPLLCASSFLTAAALGLASSYERANHGLGLASSVGNGVFFPLIGDYDLSFAAYYLLY
jgi:hypothetical protein